MKGLYSFMMSGSIRRYLRGAIELCVFMPSGAAFFTNSKKAAIASFLVPVLLAPLTVLALVLTHDDTFKTMQELPDYTNLSLGFVICLHLFFSLLSSILFLVILYVTARYAEKTENFWKIVCAGNWIAIPIAVIGIGVLMMVWSGTQEWLGIYFLMTLVIVYGYAVKAFTIAYVMNIPWELAGMLTVFALFLNESAHKTINVIGSWY